MRLVAGWKSSVDGARWPYVVFVQQCFGGVMISHWAAIWAVIAARTLWWRTGPVQDRYTIESSMLPDMAFVRPHGEGSWAETKPGVLSFVSRKT